MSPTELTEAYNLSARPYLEGFGPIPASVLSLKSWRYMVEINTACNLHCAMCINGNRKGYNHGSGIMGMELLEKVLDKIKSENPNAILCPYGNGEPFLHPHFDKCVEAMTSRGLTCEIATNLHFMDNVEGVLAAKPYIIIVSTSGFTQEIYSRAHRGGNVETLKSNLKLLSEIRTKMNSKVPIAVSFHRYKYNLHEIEPMKKFAEGLGLIFWTSHARVISMENTVQCLRFLEREKGGQVPDYPIGKDGLDLNKLFPVENKEFIKSMEQLQFHPKDSVELYKRFPVSSVCLIADVFTYVRHDGTVHLCCWTDDARFTIGNYLDMTQEQISEARRGHPFCKECLRYRMNLYYHCVDSNKWEGAI